MGCATNNVATLKTKVDITKKVLIIPKIKLGEDEGTVDGEWFKANLDKLSNIQIVDVRSPSEFRVGHLKGAINIEAEKLKAEELYAKLPKDKIIVFNCISGSRAMEIWMKLNNAKLDVSEIYYFDANLDCKGIECKIEVNEPLG
jgi:rhodanese-related sulfurtransferase